VCTSLNVTSTTAIKALAVATGFSNSAVASGTYTIMTGGVVINYGSGFSATGLKLNGAAALSGARLRLTNGGLSQASSAFYTTAVNVGSFTTDFSLQLANANADGMAFVIQNNGTTAKGPGGGGLGYGPDAPTLPAYTGMNQSVAVKFDLFNSAGEGNNSTGLYQGGASPTTPAKDMTSSGLSLHSGNVLNVHVGYDGTTLSLTITDTVTNASYSTSWTVNIPQAVGGTTGLVGFTAGTGDLTATQDVLSWTYRN
jgi:hypothetical protein